MTVFQFIEMLASKMSEKGFMKLHTSHTSGENLAILLYDLFYHSFFTCLGRVVSLRFKNII